MNLGSTTLITTKTGTYRIRGSEWQKNSFSWERLHFAHCVDRNNATWKNWRDIDSATEYPLQVGMSLYIGNFDVWWLSTEIVSIVEIQEEELDIQD